MAKSVISKREDKYLSDIYYNLGQGGSFSTVKYMLQEVKKRGDRKLSAGKIQKWLNKQKTYTDFRDVKRKFKRQHIYAGKKDAIWSLDTMNINHLKEHNKFKYVLVIVDVLSRFLRAVPLSSLKSIEVKKALQKIFLKRKPNVVTSDSGSEFKSGLMQSFLKEKGISYYYSRNDTKSPLAERSIRNIRSKMQKYLSFNKTHKWVSVLPKIVETLNHTYNRGIKTTPHDAYYVLNDVDLYRRQHVYSLNRKIIKSSKRLKRSPKSKNVFKYEVNQAVKIAVAPNLFNREIDQRFSNEIFRIFKRGVKDNIPYYEIKDSENQTIEGIFYNSELTKYEGEDNPNDLYEVEKIVSKKKINGVPMALVHWRGFNSKFNSYVPVSQIQDI